MTLSVNPLGCSPRALRAIQTMRMRDVCTYPGQMRVLGILANMFGMQPSCILLGTGSEQLIKLACLSFLPPGGTAAVESGSFFLFSREPLFLGGIPVFFDFETPEKQKKRPAVLFIANPTTPGGVDRTNDEILNVIDTLKPTIAVIDEANGEFRNDTLISEIPKRKNLIVLRTFSKALGLAGLRIGMAFGDPKTIAKMSEVQQPFPVSSAALIAAQAALKDAGFLRKTLAFVARERTFLTKQMEKRGFCVSPSVTNNLFVSRADNKKIIRQLAARDVSVIDGSFFPGNKMPGFRISLRDKRTNRKFLTRLDEALACLTREKLLGSKEII